MAEAMLRILVVDDEDGIRLSLRDYLRIKGHEVFVASDGVGAVKILLDQTIDVIITDYRMDIFGGDYWIRFLDRFCGDKRVIISSGFVRPEFKIPFEVIQKPFDYADILRLVQQHRE